jgi:taurine dioxygenase
MSVSSVREIVPLNPAIGAIVRGPDLSRPQNDATIADVRRALLKHQVIFFEDQSLTPAEQAAFAARFGKLHIHPVYPNIEGTPEVLVLDNHAGNPTDNDNWHTDVTFIETPPLGAVLYAVQLPPSGGDTIWSSMSAAWRALSSPFRAFLSGLEAVHDFARSFPPGRQVAQAAGRETYEKAVRDNPPVLHPVVRTHPETGEEGLFVNYGFTSRIKGLTGKESAAILKLLHEHIQKPEFTIRWSWKPGSLAFWDNRITQHYAVNDYLPHRRIMHRATILGDRPVFKAAATPNRAAA